MLSMHRETKPGHWQSVGTKEKKKRQGKGCSVLAGN
jgi:hypothetical protein